MRKDSRPGSALSSAPRAPVKTREDRIVRLFEYGTMQTGEKWHSLLHGAKLVGTAVTLPVYHLRDLGGYPIMTSDGTTAVHGEVYEVNGDTLKQTDMHHGHPRWHQRTTIKLASGVKAESYIHCGGCFDHRPLIESGSWKALCNAYARDITVSTKVAEMAVREVLDEAIAGPVRRWATIHVFRARPLPPGASPLPEGVHFALELLERDTGRQISLQNSWGEALSQLMTEYPQHFNQLRQAQGSATTGDILIQLAAFGHLKHGLSEER